MSKAPDVCTLVFASRCLSPGPPGTTLMLPWRITERPSWVAATIIPARRWTTTPRVARPRCAGVVRSPPASVSWARSRRQRTRPHSAGRLPGSVDGRAVTKTPGWRSWWRPTSPPRCWGTSRAGDPSPHDHVLVANVTEMLDDRAGLKPSTQRCSVTGSRPPPCTGACVRPPRPSAAGTRSSWTMGHRPGDGVDRRRDRRRGHPAVRS